MKVANLMLQKQTKPVLLFDDECGVCRRIARWVRTSARIQCGETSIVVKSIGNDPEPLRSLNPDLDIWDAYATIHLLMPDGSMRVGGEAVAEVLRHLRNTRWCTWTLAVRIFGFRPFQAMLNVAYAILADVRPLFGCESCGVPTFWVRWIGWTIGSAGRLLGAHRRPTPHPHLTTLPTSGRGH
jgi:predicted DCC family thiol-disulfide oxidoreductase YuxK